jgi:predicted glycosyltransferase
MGNHRVLYVSGSLGMGHVTRDLSIVSQLRTLRKDVDIIWLADNPVTDYLRSKGENALSDLEKLPKGSNDICEEMSKDYSLNLYPFWMEWYKTFPERAKIILAAAERENVDLIVGDEAFDLYCELQKHPKLKNKPFLLILDFIGAHQKDGIEKARNPLPLWFFNKWTADHIKQYYGKEGTLFIGEADDVVNEGLGSLLPNRRELAKKYVNCVGYSLCFRPEDLPSKEQLRKELGYGSERLILVTIGGTASGAPLLKRAAEAHTILKKGMPDLKTVLVGGPRLHEGYMKSGDGIQVECLVPDLYKHMAAADLVICSGGGTTTLELQAMNKPFIYFPFEDHFEQQVDVAYHLERDGVGKRMCYAKTTADDLAKAAMDILGKEVNYPKPRLEGAKLAAEQINNVLRKIEKGELKVAS